MTSWWQKLFVRRPVTSIKNAPKARARLGLERLEDRTVPADFTLAFQTLSTSVNETGAPSVTLTVELQLTSGTELAGAVSVDLTTSGAASSGADYTFAPTTLTFPATSVDGATQSATVDISNDRLVETTIEDAIFGFTNLQASSDTGTATGTHTVSITDNDSASVAITTPGTTTFTEGNAPKNVEVTLTLTTNGTGPARLDVPVSANLPGNGDYTATAAVFDVGAQNNDNADIVVSVVDDLKVEQTTESFAGQSLSVTTTATASASTSQTITVTDNDSASVAITTPGTTGVTEGGGSANVGVTLTLTTSGAGTAQLDVPVSANLPGNGDYSATAALFDVGAVSGATANVVVTAVNDLNVEQTTETFAGQSLTATSDATVTPSTAQTIAVTDNDSASVAITTPGTSNVTEGAASANVGVTLTLTTSGSVGTAQLDVPVSANLPGNGDYSATAAVFAAGSVNGATANVVVAAVNDLNVEQTTETFAGQSLSVTSTATATASTSQTIAVTDNDSASVAITTPGTTNVTEGGASANVGVTLTLTTSGSVGTAQLDVSVSANLPGNSDYTATAAVFNVGAASGATANIVVAAVNDLIIEPATENFAGQSLSASSTATVSASTAQTITVADNDTMTLTITPGSQSVTEGDSGTTVMTFTVTAPLAVQGGFNVDFSRVNITTANGDFSSPDTVPDSPQRLTFAGTAGETHQILVNIKGDHHVESDETFKIVLGDISGTTASQEAAITTGAFGVGTIDNDDSVTLSITNATVVEGDSGTTIMSFDVTSDGDVDGDFTVQFSVLGGGTATSGSDFTVVTTSPLNFAGTAGETHTITVNVIGDTIIERDEQFTIKLGAIGGLPQGQADGITTGAEGTGTITNDDTETLTISNASAEECGDGSQQVTFTVTSPKAVQGGFTVAFSNTDGTATSADYSVTTTSPLTFTGTAGETHTITATPVDDIVIDGDKQFTVTLGTVTAATATQTAAITSGAMGTGTIVDDDTAAARSYCAAAPGDFTIRLNFDIVTFETKLEIYQGTTLVTSDTFGAYSLTFGANSGGNNLTLDFSGGNPIPSGGLVFNGGAGSDKLVIDRGSANPTFDTITHTFINANSGTVELDPDGPGGLTSSTISYTGLEPLADNLDAANRVFDFNFGAETIELKDIVDAGGNQMNIDSNVGGESLDFANPSASLTIHAGSGGDTINVDSVDSAFRAALTIDGEGGTDTLNLDTSLLLGSTTSTGNLALTAETIHLNATSIATDGDAINNDAGSAIFTGNVILETDVAIDTDAATFDNNVTFSGTIDADNSGPHNRKLTVTAGDGTATFGGSIGSAASGTGALADLDVTAATINLNGAAVRVDDQGGNTVTFTGAVVLGNDVAIDTDGSPDNNVTFTSTINADDSVAQNRTLSLNAGGGTVTFGDSIGAAFSGSLADLDITAATVTFNGPFPTTFVLVNDQGGNTATITGNVVLGTSVFFITDGVLDNNLTFTGTINADDATTQDRSLIVLADTGTVTFGDSIGAAANGALASLFVSAATINISGGTINVDDQGGNSVSLNGSVVLGTDVIVHGGANSIFFNGAVDSDGTARKLSVVTTNVVSQIQFNGPIGGTSALDELTIDDAGPASINAVFAGSGSSLVKDGVGTLTLLPGNTYSGKTTINAGTVSISAQDALGAVPPAPDADHLTMNGGTLEATVTLSIDINRGVTLGATGGRFDVDAGQTLTINAVITGPGDLTKTDAGTLTLTTTNTYTGETNINGGTLAVTGALDSRTAAVNVNTSGLALTGGSTFTDTRQILRPIVVTAAGAQISNLALVDAPNGFAGITVNTGGIATTISNSTISGNHNTAGDGGGINVVSGDLNMVSCTISDNTTSGNGGGIHIAGGTVNLTNVTVSGNSASGTAGGINIAAGTTIFTNCTVAFNDDGGVRKVAGAALLALNTIFSSNDMFDLTGGIGGIDFGAANLVGGTALLAPLKNYTSSDPALAHAFPFTHALLPGSPALDAGLNFFLGFAVPFLDARGLARIVNTRADLGAFESSGFTVTLPPGPGFPADAAPAPAPAGDIKYRTLIDHYFVDADGTTKTDFQVQVTPNNPIEPIDEGVIRFFAGTSGSGSTGIPDNDPGTVTIDDSDGDMTALVKTNVKADNNPTGGLLPNFYELRASAGGAVGGINESVQAWRLFNQFVDGLGFSARPQTTRSGDTVIFAVDALTFSTAFSIFLQDQEGHPLNISSENVTVRAAGGPGQIDFATPLPVAGVVTNSTVAGVASFQDIKITASSFSQLYQIEARFENPNGTIVSQLSDQFRILPNTMFIDKASSSQKFFSNKRVSPIVIVVHTPRGNFNIIRSFKKQNALGAVNKIVVVALDALLDGAGAFSGTKLASFWDGPIDLTIGSVIGSQPWDLAPLPPPFPLPGSRAFLKNVFVVAPNRRIVRAMAVGGVATVKGISPANNVNLFTTFATLRYPTPAERAALPGFAIFQQDVILANTLVLPNAVNPTSQQFKRVTESRFRK